MASGTKAPKAPKGEKPKKVKVPAPNYLDLPAAKPLLDEEGRLKAVPTDYDYDKHATLKKGDFAQAHLFLDWKATAIERHAAELVKRAQEMRTESDNARKFGDPALRSKAKKVEKMKAKLAELMAELEKQGVSVPD